MSLITIDFQEGPVLAVLNELARRAQDMEPALREMGEDLQDSTMRRFVTSTGPEGERWAPNSQVTILQYLAGRDGVYAKRDGRLTKKGVAAVQGKKPLIGNTRNLSSTITYQVDGNTLIIGSPQKYAAVQQIGAHQGEFGRDRRNHPIPWGDIPARPFLGVSDEDERTILDILSSYLTP